MLPPVYLSTTHGGGFTLSLLELNVKQGSCEYQSFLVFGLSQPGIEPVFTVAVADVLFTQLLDYCRKTETRFL